MVVIDYSALTLIWMPPVGFSVIIMIYKCTTLWTIDIIWWIIQTQHTTPFIDTTWKIMGWDFWDNTCTVIHSVSTTGTYIIKNNSN